MGLNLLVRLLHLLRQALLEQGGGDWVLLGLSPGRRDGGGLRYRRGCGCWGRNRGWLNCLYRFLCRWFRLRSRSNTFWLRRRLQFSLFGFRNWFAVGPINLMLSKRIVEDMPIEIILSQTQATKLHADLLSVRGVVA